MRLKIPGELSVENIILSISNLQNAIGVDFKILNTNIYLNLKTEDGEDISIVDKRGNDVIFVNGHPPFGTQIKCIINKKAQSPKPEYEDFQKEKARALNDEMEENLSPQKVIDTLDEVTAKILSTYPKEFISDMNSTVKTVWSELMPVYPHGKNKGKPLPMPWYRVDDGKLLLHRDQGELNFTRVSNPVRRIQHQEISKFWQNPAWAKVDGLLQELISHYIEKINAGNKVL